MSSEASIDLCGPWGFQPDPFDEGEKGAYFEPGHDRSRWIKAQIPCCIDDISAEMSFYEGPAWFARSIEIPADWRQRRVCLRFAGVNYRARVWVDGEAVIDNQDPFLPFEARLDDLVEPGQEALIVVRSDNTRRFGDVPPPHIGWRNFGGILREVELLATDRLFIGDLRVQAMPTVAGGALMVNLTIVNDRIDGAAGQVVARLTDLDGAALGALTPQPVALAPGERTSMFLAGDVADVTPWSPATPQLYRLTVGLESDGDVVREKEVRFGFRSIETRSGNLQLNGDDIYLTGYNRHEDSFRTGLATDLETTRRDLEEMKASGCNFVRLCHYPHHPGELDLCDEIGLLAMAEIPLYWWGRPEKGYEKDEDLNSRTLEQASRQLATMVRRDWNHPSVAMWSVGNENGEMDPDVVAVLGELCRQARKLDGTRPATHVSQEWPEHPHFDDDSVICVNSYPSLGLYRRAGDGANFDFAEATEFWRERLAALHEQYPHKPILVSEFGFTSAPGVSGNAYGEDVHARALEAQFEGMDAPYVCGAVIWCWADHAWPAGQLYSTESPRTFPAISPYGVLSRERQKLAPFEAAKRMFLAKHAKTDGEEG